VLNGFASEKQFVQFCARFRLQRLCIGGPGSASGAAHDLGALPSLPAFFSPEAGEGVQIVLHELCAGPVVGVRQHGNLQLAN